MTRYFACECGASRTATGLYENDELLGEIKGGPCNPAVQGTEACLEILVELAQRLPGAGVGIEVVVTGMAGAVDPAQRLDLGQRLCARLGAGRTLIATDLHPMLYANAGDNPGILAIAGTGSSVLGQDRSGQIFQAGGRGHVLGDAGSAYHLAVAGLRAAARSVDGLEPSTVLVEALPAAAGVSSFAELTSWSLSAEKATIAALAPMVADAAVQGDAVARSCVDDQAKALAAQVQAVGERLGESGEIPVFLSGGLFDKCGLFLEIFEAALRSTPALRPCAAKRRGHRAMLALAHADPLPSWVTVANRATNEMPDEEALPPTERRTGAARTIDQMTALEIATEMNREDATVAPAVVKQLPVIARVIEAAARALQSGGRILYLGAGTSGRLGVLDASECPPTFGVAPDRVIGIIAGGDKALRNSVEGCEDDRAQAETDLDAYQVGPKDLVVGVTASGATRYVRAALEAAGRRGAVTALLCCNPDCASGADFVIAVDTGPEVLAGSTRLKAGTATKMVLNMISTGAMSRIGQVYDGLMAGMRPANAKLRRRAERIVAHIAGVSETAAADALAKADYHIATAIVMLRRGCGREAAQAALDKADGVLRAALGEERRRGR